MWISVRLRPADAGIDERPARIDGTTGTKVHAGRVDDLVCRQTQQVIRFRDHGWLVDAAITWGPDTSADKIEDAYAILNSMKVGPLD
jgi:hypothetical protein